MTIQAMIRIVVDKPTDRASVTYIPTLLRMFAKGLEDQGLKGVVYSEAGQLAEPLALSLIDVQTPEPPDEGGSSMLHIGPPVMQAQLEFHVITVDPAEAAPDAGPEPADLR